MKKQLALYIDNCEVVDGVVIEGEEKPRSNAFFNFFASFFGRSPYNDNGREYNHVSDKWEYTAERNGNVSGCDMTGTMKDLFPRGDEQYDGT